MTPQFIARDLGHGGYAWIESAMPRTVADLVPQPPHGHDGREEDPAGGVDHRPDDSASTGA